MSKYNNVNPGQYKVGGRERPDTMATARIKQNQKEQVRAGAPTRDAAPNKVKTVTKKATKKGK